MWNPEGFNSPALSQYYNLWTKMIQNESHFPCEQFIHNTTQRCYEIIPLHLYYYCQVWRPLNHCKSSKEVNIAVNLSRKLTSRDGDTKKKTLGQKNWFGELKKRTTQPIGWLYLPVFQQSALLFRCMSRNRLFSLIMQILNCLAGAGVCFWIQFIIKPWQKIWWVNGKV